MSLVDRGLDGALAPEGCSKQSSRLGRFRILIEIAAIFGGLFTLTRIGFLVAFADFQKLSAIDFANVAFVGFRFDLFVSLLLIQPQLWHFTWSRNSRVLKRSSLRLMHACWFLAFLVPLLLIIVETLFFNEFDVRLNYIAFEYLIYPTEVCVNIWQSYAVVPLVAGLLITTVALLIGMRSRFIGMLENTMPFAHRVGFFAATWLAVVTLWLTMGMSTMNCSNNRVANECSGNGVYTFVANAWNCHFSYADFYQTMDADEAAKEVLKCVASDRDTSHPNSQNPIDRTVHGPKPRHDWNVVIVVEESLGSDFVGALGDKRGLTPHLDKLAEEGTLFDNFYATGNRTARALEAITTTLPPIPTEAILKRDHSQHVFTLAHVLEKRGYERLFISAGRGLFDGVRSFMTANGFNRFVEQKDFINPSLITAWGVADEDLFERGLTEIDDLHSKKTPFLTMLLTVSNHRPFTYPEGRIDLLSSAQKREHAVKYADWSLGQFFQKARTRPWYENTVFVVLGDHGARVFGSQMFPLKSYRVPVLMIHPGDSQKGVRCSKLACTIDIAPTILGLLGDDYRSTFFGRDVLNLPADQGYALMQHNHEVALLSTDGELVVLDARRQCWVYDVDPTTMALKPRLLQTSDRTRQTIAFFQMGNSLYYSDRLFPSY